MEHKSLLENQDDDKDVNDIITEIRHWYIQSMKSETSEQFIAANRCYHELFTKIKVLKSKILLRKEYLPSANFLADDTLDRYIYVLRQNQSEVADRAVELGFNLTFENSERQFNQKQVALIHVYSGHKITRKNSTEIALSYGWNSGESLYQEFIYYDRRSNRIARPNNESAKSLRNKIEIFESVIPFVEEENRPIIFDEIQILKGFEKDYE